MHTISYEGLPEAEKRAKALEDCRFWLGNRFDSMVEDLRKNAPKPMTQADIKGLAKCLFIAGIQGYPATVMAEHVAGI
jgi:hypothetical protein